MFHQNWSEKFEKVLFIALGIGYETAKRLSYMGAKVIMACRDEDKAQKVCGLDTLAFNSS